MQETLFEFLERSDHPRADAARQWLQTYGEPYVGDARWNRNFRSKKQEQPISAFFELYGYEMFRRLGCAILEVEPSHGGGSPDLRLRSPLGVEFIVEMACVFESQAEDQQIGDVARLWDMLSSAAPGYNLKLTPTEKFPHFSALPSRGKILAQLGPLQPGNTVSFRNSVGDDWFYVEVSTDGWNGPSFHFRKSRAGEKIRNTLRKKNRQFDAEGVPVVVLLNSVTTISYPMWDLKEALWGAHKISVPVPLISDTPKEPVRHMLAGHSAAWLGDGGPAGTSQSAVVVCANIGPFNFGGGEGSAVVHDHPWAKTPLDTGFIPFTRCVLHKESGEVEEMAGTRILTDLFP